MEQWYKDGKVFNSQQAIRNDNPNTSLPHFLTDSDIEALGYIKVVDSKPTYDVNTEYLSNGALTLINGIPTLQYLVSAYTTEELQAMQAEAMARLVQHFTDVTTAYIEAKVQEYNKAHGLAFKDIDAFTKYAVNPLSVHNAIANRFISYADKVWTTVRNYQSTATSAPTETEFISILDSVVF